MRPTAALTNLSIPDRLEAKLAYLRDSRAFDGVREVIETHMSWVFLTDRHAYKLKKPVQLPFLDHRTLERRERSCETELRLGRRLAPDVYEGVVPLVAAAGGLAIGGAGEIVDWIVVMRRLPADRMLPQMLARGEATAEHADAVGELLARFYRDAVRTTWSGDEYRRRLRDQVISVSRELVERQAHRATVDEIVHVALFELEREARAFDARVAGGHVVDAHGDLRPEHVCLEASPVVIDPLEFDDDLRTLDAASELAFFELECERLGAHWFSEGVDARYAELCRDRVPASVRAFYRRQHALTRALIALRHVDDVEPREQSRWRAKADDYLARAVLAPHAALTSTAAPPSPR